MAKRFLETFLFTFVSLIGIMTVSSKLKPETFGSITLPKGSQWATVNSNISYSAGNVGIGTTTPGVPLVVVGYTYFSSSNTPFIMKTPNDSCLKMALNAAGSFTTSSIACP
jgi:hypothetical protein